MKNLKNIALQKSFAKIFCPFNTRINLTNYSVLNSKKSIDNKKTN